MCATPRAARGAPCAHGAERNMPSGVTRHAAQRGARLAPPSAAPSAHRAERIAARGATRRAARRAPRGAPGALCALHRVEGRAPSAASLAPLVTPRAWQRFERNHHYLGHCSVCEVIRYLPKPQHICRDNFPLVNHHIKDAELLEHLQITFTLAKNTL